MAHDYAHRPQRARAQAAPATRFHWTSFGSGVAIGVALTVSAVTAPRWWPTNEAPPPKVEEASVPADKTPRYEFYERLPRVQVATDPTPYGAPISPRESSAQKEPTLTTPSNTTPAGTDGDPSEFVLQAGSFSNREDADRLRGTLEAMGLNSIATTVRVGGVQRHRVLVGPFATEVDVHRALTQLRERDIDALLMARKSG